MQASLLDASALLALIQNEPGADTVRDAVRDGASISAVNLAEVAARLCHRGWPAEVAAAALRKLGIGFLPFDSEIALQSGALRPATAPLGLGLGDRACLATAASQGIPALTADRVWSGLRIPGVPGVEVRLIR